MTSDAETAKKPLWRRKGVLVPLALAGAVVIAAAAFATEPWTLFRTDSVVDEVLPAATGPAVPGGSPSSSGPEPTASPTPNPSSRTGGPRRGSLHQPRALHVRGRTRARARRRDPGPSLRRAGHVQRTRLRVWITDAPVIQGRDGWFVFDDGASVDLGPLKGTRAARTTSYPPVWTSRR